MLEQTFKNIDDIRWKKIARSLEFDYTKPTSCELN